jgi:hypothetical protein
MENEAGEGETGENGEGNSILTGSKQKGTIFAE